MGAPRIGATAAVGSKLTSVQTRVLILLAFSVCINYVDRGTLSVAAPQLTTELKLDPKQMGLLLSSFFWTYALCQMLAGWLVDRYDVRWVFGVGYLLWSGATFATGLSAGLASLFGLRLLLGMGESVAYPSYSKIIAGSFPQSHRGTANAAIDMASKIGPALGTLLGGLLVANYGWRSLFITVGAVSLAWLIPWTAWGPKDRALAISHSAAAPGILEILGKREAWGTFFGLFGANYIWYFLLTWLPSYLVQQRHFSETMMAQLGSLPFFMIALSSMISGWASDRLIARGGDTSRVRKFFISTGLFMGCLVLPAAMVENRALCMALLIAASLCYGMCSSNIWAITQTLAGPAAAGKWTGLQNAFGNLAGVVAPSLTGWVVKETHSFVLAFVATAVAASIGGLSFLFVVPKVEPIAWRVRPKG
jgi:MFS transporter, ACS family, D-galactonate transporter